MSAVLREALILQSAKNAVDSTASQKLAEFESYPPGWAYGDGMTFSSGVTSIAKKLLLAGQSNGLFSADVFPGLEGELRVTFYSDHDYWEFTVLASEKIEYLHEQDHALVDERQELNLEDALQEIETQGQKQWNVSALSRLNISIVGLGDSKIFASNPRAQTAQFQSSTRSAPRQIPDLFALTLKPITGT